jgi:hypothetical protein
MKYQEGKAGGIIFFHQPNWGKEQVMLSKHQHTRIVSSTPGRTRFRVSHKHRTRKDIGHIVDAIQDRFGGEVEAHADVRTGSILVHHPHHSAGDITSIMADLEVIFGGIADVDIPSPGGRTKVASNIADAVSDLNSRIGLMTHGIINLRVLVPMGLGALALFQLLRRGLQIEMAPWYVLAYAAFDSFVMLHRATDERRQQAGDETYASSSKPAAR